MLRMPVGLETETCKVILGELEPVDMSGSPDTIGSVALYDVREEDFGIVAAIVILTMAGEVYGEGFTHWPDAEFRWLEFDEVYTITREEPVQDDLVFYQDEESGRFILEPRGIVFSCYKNMEKFLRTHLYPGGRDLSRGRRIWFYDRAIGNWYLWDLMDLR